MTTFAAQVLQLSPAVPDPTRHVNYTLGMVLGVDDFMQEFAYLAGRSQWITRDLLGYGTVSGLKVSIEQTQRGPQVVVAPGVAVNPQGQFIRVPDTQCAILNDWLALPANSARLNTLPSSPMTDIVQLQVVLCYNETATDKVPIPGEPCRSEDDLMADSRLQDDFSLELRPTATSQDPPDQREYEAARLFAELLGQIQVTSNSALILPLDQFEDAIRGMGPVIQSALAWLPDIEPASPPTYTFGSLAAPLYIPAGRVGDYMHSAFRIWVTDLRPQWEPNGPGVAPDENCVLLADLFVPTSRDALTGDWLVDDTGTVLVDETHRPYMISLQLLQEWLLASILTSGGAQGLQGPPGPQGPAGPQGQQGPQGSAGGILRGSVAGPVTPIISPSTGLRLPGHGQLADSGGLQAGAARVVDGGAPGIAGALASSLVKEDLAPLLFPLQSEALPALSLLTGRNSTSRPRGALSDSCVVAAGRFGAAGEVEFASNGLVARRLQQPKQLLYLVSGRWFDPDGTYMVKGNAVVGLKSTATYSFATVSESDPDLCELLEQAGYSTLSGIVLRVTRADNRPVDSGFLGLTLEISRYA